MDKKPKKKPPFGLILLFGTLLFGLVIGLGILSRRENTLKRIDISTPTANSGSSKITPIQPYVPSDLENIKIDKETFRAKLRSCYKKKDEFEEMTWYYDQSSPKFTNANAIECYIGKDATKVFLRFRVQYLSDDWLFIDNAIFNIDGVNFDYIPGKVERDNGGGDIWEWFDEPGEGQALLILSKLANARSAKVKFNGHQYYNIRQISSRQRQAIKHVLQVYKGFLLHYDK
ncbi:hypothetical protein [Pararcticibacter amylolyticus]|nr:hypothetical protein [Pararcticibacter amylolyticus]